MKVCGVKCESPPLLFIPNQKTQNLLQRLFLVNFPNLSFYEFMKIFEYKYNRIFKMLIELYYTLSVLRIFAC